MTYAELCRELRDLALARPYYLGSDEPDACEVVCPANERRFPAYTPFVGMHYLESQPRILVCAMNQSIASDLRRPEDYTVRWAADPRDNAAFLQSVARCYAREYDPREGLGIRPHDEGFVQILSAILMAHLPPREDPAALPDGLTEHLALANYVRFSFHQPGNPFANGDPPPEAYCDSWRHYLRREIQLMRPSWVIALGRDVSGRLSGRFELPEGCRVVALHHPSMNWRHNQYYRRTIGSPDDREVRARIDSLAGTIGGFLAGEPPPAGLPESWVKDCLARNSLYFLAMARRIGEAMVRSE